MDGESLIVVLVALVANVLIAIMKFVGFLLTGSPSMLAETYHTISDTGNQLLLLVGLYYAKKRATRGHPFGYGKAVFFYGLLVSVLLFGIAGWESAKHGISSLRHGAPIMDGTVTVRGVTFRAVYVNYAVLVGTIVFDGISYWRAHVSLAGEVEERGYSGLREAYEKTSNITVLAVFTENAIATVGATIALVAIFLADITGNPAYDAAGALAIGVLLMVFALRLGWENKRLLLGEALPALDERPLEAIVQSWEGVQEVIDFRTVYFGPDNVVITADVAFDGKLDTEEIDRLITEIETELRFADDRITKIYIEPEVS